MGLGHSVPSFVLYQFHCDLVLFVPVSPMISEVVLILTPTLHLCYRLVKGLVHNSTETRWDPGTIGLENNATGTGTRCDWDTMGLGHNGTGTQWDSDTMELEHNGTGTQWNWNTVGLGHNGTGTQWDWDTMELDWDTI